MRAGSGFAAALIGLAGLGISVAAAAQVAGQAATPAPDPGYRNMTVTVDGAVGHAGSAVYAADARLSHVTDAADVNADAYVLGAAWLQPTLRRDQLRLKAGLVYELGAVRRKAIGFKHEDLAVTAAAFQGWLMKLPVTGRRIQSALDPARLQVTPSDNWPVHDGDRLFYPPRPSVIHVVGAVAKACDVPQVALQDARRYLKDCPASPAADPDMIFVVQPDGAVFQQDTALWNRDAPRPLAPGAWIYVPFDRKAIREAAEDDFNPDVAAFLATQVPDDPAQVPETAVPGRDDSSPAESLPRAPSATTVDNPFDPAPARGGAR